MSYNLIGKIANRLRVRYFSLWFNIGKGCSFGKVKFWDCEKGSIKIGNKVVILRKTELCAKTKLPISIGNGTFLNQQCIIRPNTYVGNNVDLGPRVMLISDTHEKGTSSRRAGKSIFLPIKIEEGCWIGANATILGGVTIGEGCIIGAGSLVNKDCEPNSLYAGVPAKLIRKLY